MSTDSPTTPDTSDVSRTLLLNALRDVVLGTNAVVHGESRHRLERSFHAATSSGERGAFVTALHEVEEAAEEPVDDDTHRTLRGIVDDVLEHLDAADASFTVHHESGTEIAPRDVALYNFWQTRDPLELDRLECSPAVREALETGATAVADDASGERTPGGDAFGSDWSGDAAFEDALVAFDRAVDASETTDEAVAARLLAALAAHWSADDALAMDYLEEALQLESDAWPATMLASVVDDASSQAYRDGSLAVQAYLRVRARVPEGSTLDVRIGRGERGETDWESVTTSLDCVPIRRLSTHLRAAFELTGPATRLPALDAYYVALGTVEPASEVPRTTDHILLDGPITEDANEELHVDTSSP